jgi:3-oxo-5-alpha-steroid 4-dehydrogenase 1
MNELQFYNILLSVFGGMAICVFVVLFFVSAPYGRFSRSGWGPRIDNRWGWFLMEVPASILFFFYFFISDRSTELVPVLFLIIWQSHYIYRVFGYPITLQRKRSMPLMVILFAVVFNVFNTYIQARWIFTLSPDKAYTIDWLKDPRFIVGVLLFYGGFAVNRHSDRILRVLRKSGKTEYSIPQKGLFHFVSCPNYLGEIIQWLGWALALWSISGLMFAFWTVANLLPRARSHHQWYVDTFPDYPRNRKALIPHII